MRTAGSIGTAGRRSPPKVRVGRGGSEMDDKQIKEVETLFNNISQMFVGVDGDVVGATLASLVGYAAHSGCLELEVVMEAVKMGVEQLEAKFPPKE